MKILDNRIKLHAFLKEDICSKWYDGEFLSDGTRCLVITYHANLLDEELVKKLLYQADKISDFEHKNLLKMLGYGYDGECFYTLYKSINTFQTFESWLKKQEKWPKEKLWRLASQLLRCGEYLEKNNSFLGTLSLSNLILDPFQDMKLVRIVFPALILKARFNELSFFDDAIFLAPEIFINQEFTRYSDIYSYGVLLYYFFSQSWPYEHSLNIDFQKENFLGKRRPFIPTYSNFPKNMSSMIENCLKLGHKNRYYSFENIREEYKKNIRKRVNLSEDQVFKKELNKKIMREKSQRFRSKISWVLMFSLLLFFILGSYLTVVVYVTAIPSFIIPDLKGFSQEEAHIRLAKVGFKSSIQGAYFSQDVPRGKVIASKPPFGRQVKKDRHIALFISKGKTIIRMPDLKGMQKDQAKHRLNELGLVVEDLEFNYSNEYPLNYIISQNPTANYLVDPSQNVKLTLSQGFPVEIWEKSRHFDFFNRQTSKRIFVKIAVLEEWGDQEIVIYFQSNQDVLQKIYQEKQKKNTETTLEFELEKTGELTIFFNEEKAMEVSVNDIKVKEKKSERI